MTLRDRLAAGAKQREGSRIIALRIWAYAPVRASDPQGLRATRAAGKVRA